MKPAHRTDSRPWAGALLGLTGLLAPAVIPGCGGATPADRSQEVPGVVSVGMDFDAAKRALEACGARETTLDMMYTPEFTTYELADGRILCVTLDGPVKAEGARTVVRLSECRDSDKLKSERTYDSVLSTRLK